MRKMLLVMSLAGLTVWADASDAFAQVFVRRGGNIVYGDGYGNYGYGGSYLPFGGAFLPYGGANLPDVYSGSPENNPNYQVTMLAPNYSVRPPIAASSDVLCRPRCGTAIREGDGARAHRGRSGMV